MCLNRNLVLFFLWVKNWVLAPQCFGMNNMGKWDMWEKDPHEKGLCDTFTCSTEQFSHGPQQPPAWPDRHPGPSFWMTSCTHKHTHSHIISSHKLLLYSSKLVMDTFAGFDISVLMLAIVKWNWVTESTFIFSMRFHLQLFAVCKMEFFHIMNVSNLGEMFLHYLLEAYT